MKRRGFTLIELIVVLVVISIGVGISMLKISLVEKIGEKNEIQGFVDDYLYLKDLSLSSGIKYTMDFNEDGYDIKGLSVKTRKLKYIKSLNVTSIEFEGNGYVNAEKNKPGHNLIFVSKRDPNTKWYFTIEAVGGYLSEKY